MNLYEMIFEGSKRIQFLADDNESAKKQTMEDNRRCSYVMLFRHNQARIHHYKWELVGKKILNDDTGQFEWHDFNELDYL